MAGLIRQVHATPLAMLRHGKILKDANERIVQLEQDNALLGLVLLSVLRQMGKTCPGDVETIADEVRQVLQNPEKAAPGSLKILRDALGLTPAPAPESPPGIFAKPVAATPVRTPGPPRSPPQGRGPARPLAKK